MYSSQRGKSLLATLKIVVYGKNHWQEILSCQRFVIQRTNIQRFLGFFDNDHHFHTTRPNRWQRAKIVVSAQKNIVVYESLYENRCIQIVVYKSLYQNRCIEMVVCKSLYQNHCTKIIVRISLYINHCKKPLKITSKSWFFFVV